MRVPVPDTASPHSHELGCIAPYSFCAQARQPMGRSPYCTVKLCTLNWKADIAMILDGRFVLAGIAVNN